MVNPETKSSYGLGEQRGNGKGQKGGAKSPREFIRLRTVFNKVEPLLIRGASSDEIMLMTGFSRKNVNNAINRKTKSTKRHRVGEEFFAPERVRERMSRSHKGKPKRLIDRPPMSQEAINRIESAKEVIGHGFITKDLGSWKQLQDIYAASKRSLPDNFYDRIRLESLVVALSDLNRRRNDSKLFKRYYGIGKNIDVKWFSQDLKEEELYIADNFYILALTEARKLWSEKEDRSLIEAFPKFYIQQDPTRPTRLNSKILIIRKSTPTNNPILVSKIASPVHGEVKLGEQGW